MASTYSLLIQSVDGVSWKPGLWHHKEPNLYIVIFQDGREVSRTGEKRGLAPQWEHRSTILLNSESSVISLKLLHDSALPGGDMCLGVIETSIEALLEMCASGDTGKLAKLQFQGVDEASKGKPAGALSVRLVREADAGASAVEEAQRTVENIKLSRTSSTIVKAAGVITNSPATVEKLQSALDNITSKLQVLVKLGDQIATIHPYAYTAWKILTSVYQVVKQQQEADEKLLKLVATMAEVHSFVEDTGFLVQRIKSLEDQTLAIARQTADCTYFIQEYMANGFCSRALRNTWTHVDEKIDHLSATLLEMKKCFEGRLTIQSLFLSTKIMEKLDTLEQSDALKKLNPMDMNDISHGESRAVCLPGTRREILDDITEWLSIPSGSGNVFWLCGVAGAGKSTISDTVSDSFRGLERLGAFLFFDRNDRARSHPDSVIRTLAYSLAQSNPHIASAISAAITRNPAVVSAHIRDQFKALLLDPLTSVEQSIHGPIVVILDALDECGDPDSRAVLLSVLSVELPKLPHLFRFLITSRAEKDIADQFQTRFVTKQLDVSSGIADIALFIRHEMEEIRNREDYDLTWPGDPSIQQLVDLSGGLFIWAKTAARFIAEYNPDGALKKLLAHSFIPNSNLYDLYAVALRRSGPWDTNQEFAQDARAVLACLVLGRVPMTAGTMDILLNRRSAGILKRLGCVIQWSPGAEARTLHASFADYLTDPDHPCKDPWAIDIGEQHHSLALGCLRVLNRELRFNICSLEDSHVLNTDVPDISQRVAAQISPPLSYSSRFWFCHIQKASFDEMVFKEMKSFLLNQFLCWLEVLSLLGEMSLASAALGVAAEYVKQGDDEDLQDFIADAMKLVSAFAPLIAQSAPHIYLSVLASAPKESRVVRHFDGWFPRRLFLQGPLTNHWPSLQKEFTGRHTAVIGYVCFSPDGTRLISGSWDKTWRIWDTETGVVAVELPQGPTGWITTVHFSPDGSQIASGSDKGIVCIWDARTGAQVFGPVQGHTEVVCCVQFSPNGAHIASASERTVRIWDLQTATLVTGWEARTNGVAPFSFSPDGRSIASGSADNTIRLWNAHTGELLVEFLDQVAVDSIGFSPDSTRIVCGCQDGTVRVWDVQTGVLVLGPLEGHVYSVLSVDFSRSDDGARIASGSQDGALRVWDSRTGALVCGPLEADGFQVMSVHFSPDGRRIASGSEDGALRIWDTQSGPVESSGICRTQPICMDFSPHGDQIACGMNTWQVMVGGTRTRDDHVLVRSTQTGAILAGPFQGHSALILCVRFAPSGAWIASGSEDKTVRVWHAKTGALIAGPMDHGAPVYSMVFSSDSERITTISGDGLVRVWDTQSGGLVILNLEQCTDDHDCLTLSPNGTRIAGASVDGTVRIWDSHGSLLRATMHYVARFRSLHFSPDDTRIAAVFKDNTLGVLDGHTGLVILGPLKRHTGEIGVVDFSPDRSRFASGAWDRTICVWDAQTGDLVAGPLEGHTAGIDCVQFSPDGTSIASASSLDDTMRIWDIQTPRQGSQTNSSPTNELEDYPMFDLHTGWVSESGKRMFWVPPWLREGLYFPRNAFVIRSRGTTKLDFSRFVHGREWANCIDPAFRDKK